MADTARTKADKELAKMEKYLASVYKTAGKQLERKAKDYMKDFERLEKEKQAALDAGTITQDEFDEWRKNKLLYGTHWTNLISYVQAEMLNANKTAIDYINGKTPQIYADSYNHLAEVIADSDVKGYNFELVDANTVKNIASAANSGMIMLPSKDLDEEKDKRWNAKKVNSELLQGILQGESIPKIAARVGVATAESNGAAAIRNARTMVTAAENSGRQSGMNKAQEDGIIFKKVWIATSDERTRESHVMLNGTEVDPDENFVTINDVELEFPGDWRADGCEVYNCRCSLGTRIVGFKKKQLDETIEKQQEQPNNEVDNPEETSKTNEMPDRISEIRERYNNASTPKEREQLICEAGNEIRETIVPMLEGYNQIVEERNKAADKLRPEIERLTKLKMELFSEIMHCDTEMFKAGYSTPEAERIKEEREKLKEEREKVADECIKLIEKQREIIASYKEQVQKELDKIKEHNKEAIRNVRDCGTSTPLDTFVTNARNTAKSKDVTAFVHQAIVNYPSDWLDALESANTLRCDQVSRGYFSAWRGELMISGGDDEHKIRTSYHELGHFIENNVPSVLEAEREFYNRRTEGEKLKWLGSGYAKSEKSRFDDFINPYIGKDYGGAAYEVVSMGFERYFEAPQELLKDEDYANFIIGVLCLC